MHKKSGLVRKMKVAVFSMTAVGMLHASACSLGDLRLNLVNGTLAFVKGYTTDMWEALIPAADDLVNLN